MHVFIYFIIINLNTLNVLNSFQIETVPRDIASWSGKSDNYFIIIAVNALNVLNSFQIEAVSCSITSWSGKSDN